LAASTYASLPGECHIEVGLKIDVLVSLGPGDVLPDVVPGPVYGNRTAKLLLTPAQLLEQ